MVYSVDVAYSGGTVYIDASKIHDRADSTGIIVNMKYPSLCMTVGRYRRPLAIIPSTLVLPHRDLATIVCPVLWICLQPCRKTKQDASVCVCVVMKMGVEGSVVMLGDGGVGCQPMCTVQWLCWCHTLH